MAATCPTDGRTISIFQSAFWRHNSFLEYFLRLLAREAPYVLALFLEYVVINHASYSSWTRAQLALERGCGRYF